MKDYILGIILADSSLYNKVISNINLKDKKIIYYGEEHIYEDPKLFFSNLKYTVKGVIYINSDDYITSVIKNADLTKQDLEDKNSTYLIHTLLKKLGLKFLYIKIPFIFNATKRNLCDLESYINYFYKELEE